MVSPLLPSSAPVHTKTIGRNDASLKADTVVVSMDMAPEAAQTEAVTKRDILVGVPDNISPGKIDDGVAAHSDRHQVRFEIEEVSNDFVV